VNHFIDAALEPGLWRLADWSLRWALLIGLLAGGLLLVRPRRAATRSLAGWLVLLGGLILPALPHWGPPLTLPRAREAAPAPAAETPPVPATVSAARAVEPVVAPGPTLGPENVARAQPLGARRLAVLTLAVLWATGVTLLLVRLVGGWLVLIRMRGSAVPLGGAAVDFFAACRTQVGLRRPVALATHPAVGSPVTLGLFRPVVLVPPDWPDLDEPARRASLLHELAHLARRDDWAALLFELVRAAFFFHPGVRWLLARLECERELLCDEAALAGGLDAHSYARMLVDFSRRCGRLLPAPLAAAAHPLRIGGRRTVTVRIHHLLEENMKQWLSPTPRWQALTLGIVVLGLAAVLGSFRVGAGEPPITLPNDRYLKDEKKEADPPPAKEEPAVKKEALRYGGKSFDQWRTELVTELKPDIRIDGIKALREFGANGYGPEATAAILQVMRGYDINGGNKDDVDVFQAGIEAVRKIGKPSVTPLIGGVRGDNRNGRRFAVNALGQLDSDAQAAAPALIKAMRDEDALVRENAANAVYRIQPEAQGFAAALAEMLKDDLPSLRANAASFLGNLKLSEGRAFTVPALVAVLEDPDANVRLAAISALVNIKPPARELIPGVAKRLTDNFSTVQRQAFEIINTYGPEAKAAVPALIAIARDSSASIELRLQAIGALGQIGPNAREAVPVLKKLLEEKALNPNLRVTVIESQNSIQKALEKIDK
jgi:beta-lactamase regulating signal transducer with metallopeptidase domain/HEAT repeat protein